MESKRPAGHRKRSGVTSRPRLLLLQPLLEPPGGGEAVAVAVIEALKDDHDITILTLRAIDLGAVHRFTGSTLRPSDFKLRVVSPELHWIRKLPQIDAALWQRHIILRHARRMIGEFDLAISVNNEIDVGRRALQYIHYPWGYWPRPDADLRWFHRIPGVLPLYYRLGDMIAPVSAGEIANNRTLVNSDWTGEKFRERYSGETTTVYPPITAAPLVPWSEREDTFVVLGRIAPEKEIETAIRIVDGLRAAGHPVRLRIVGSVVGQGYYRKIRRLVETRDWATIHLDVSRDERLAILSRSRYGLHAMSEEHFGMAPAEMARSGCVVFVPRAGGQVEVVGGDDRVMYGSVDEAISKISRVLSAPWLQSELQQMLLARGTMFAPERFRDRIRAIVAEELAR